MTFHLFLVFFFGCRNQEPSLEVMSMALIAPSPLKFPCPPYLPLPPPLLSPHPPSLLPPRFPFPPFPRTTSAQDPLVLRAPPPPYFATRGLPLRSQTRSLPVSPLGSPSLHRLSMTLPTAPLLPSHMPLGQHDLQDQDLQWYNIVCMRPCL